LLGLVRFVNVLRAFWAYSTVLPLVELFNYKRQGHELATHSWVSSLKKRSLL